MNDTRYTNSINVYHRVTQFKFIIELKSLLYIFLYKMSEDERQQL